MTHLRLPAITGKTEVQQLQQLKSYLYQLVQELNITLSTLEQTMKEGNHGSKEN